MRRRLLLTGSLLSLAMCATASALWLVSFDAPHQLTYENHGSSYCAVAFAGKVLVGHQAGGFGASLLPHGLAHEPYPASMSQEVYGDQLDILQPLLPLFWNMTPERHRISDVRFCGILYQTYAWETRLQNGRRVTSPRCASYLLIPVPWLIAVFGLLPLYSALAWRRRHLRAADRARCQCCPACGYNLLGNTSGVCPECGAAIPRGPEAGA